jgi:hypothetical protein
MGFDLVNGMRLAKIDENNCRISKKPKGCALDFLHEI